MEIDRMAQKGRESGQKFRMAVVAQQVVQYHSPLYRELAESRLVRPTVLFLDRAGVEPVFSKILNQMVVWDVPLLEGFEYEFLQNWSPARQRFMVSRINPGVLRCLTSGRFDGVLIQGYDTVSAWLAYMTAKVCGVSVLFRGETVLKPDGDSGTGGYVKRRLVQTILRGSDAVLYSCSGNRQAFLHYGCDERKMFAIPCAVDNDLFRQQKSKFSERRNALRQELGIDSHECVFVFAGRLSGVKCQHDLLRAAALLRNKGHEPVVLLVGEGPARGEIECLRDELRLKRTIMVGFVNQSQIGRYYTLADVQVLCSEYDPSPKVINEGMNFGLPIICSDRPGTIGDTIVHGVNGWVYRYGEITELAEAMELMMSDRCLRERMGQESLRISDQWNLAADVKGIEKAVNYIQNSKKTQNDRIVHRAGCHQ